GVRGTRRGEAPTKPLTPPQSLFRRASPQAPTHPLCPLPKGRGGHDTVELRRLASWQTFRLRTTTKPGRRHFPASHPSTSPLRGYAQSERCSCATTFRSPVPLCPFRGLGLIHLPGQ